MNKTGFSKNIYVVIQSVSKSFIAKHLKVNVPFQIATPCTTVKKISVISFNLYTKATLQISIR